MNLVLIRPLPRQIGCSFSLLPCPSLHKVVVPQYDEHTVITAYLGQYKSVKEMIQI